MTTLTQQHHHRGFTLIELMIGLVIMVFTLAVGLPNFQGVLDSSRLTSASNDLLVALQIARSTAIKEVRTAGVSIATNGQSWYAFLNSSTLTGSPPPGRLLQSYVAPNNVTIDTSDFTPGYRPDGRLNSATAITIRVLSTNGATGSDARILTINPSGLVSITNGSK